eukprot:Rhum_TRINITY_DN7282_c0_g1::Rhum_TRINITY_DN7282_c0_g1_i1::g.22397::m.22397
MSTKSFQQMQGLGADDRIIGTPILFKSYTVSSDVWSGLSGCCAADIPRGVVDHIEGCSGSAGGGGGGVFARRLAEPERCGCGCDARSRSGDSGRMQARVFVPKVPFVLAVR